MTSLSVTLAARVVVWDPPGEKATSDSELKVVLAWEPTDPAAVSLRVGDLADGGAVWVFDRELLEPAVTRGLGDVRVTTDSMGTTIVSLHGLGRADVHLPRPSVDSFRSQVARECPLHAAAYDVDAWLRELTE